MGPSGSYTQRFFALLEILKRKSNPEHRFQQLQLAQELESSYQMTVDRRSVRKALDEMQKIGYPVKYDRGWYYQHEFSETELDYIIDSIRFNNCLSSDQQNTLINKIAGLGSKWYLPPENVSSLRPCNAQFLKTLSIIHTAIKDGTQVEFNYGNYDTDKILHPRLNRSGNPKLYVINPYQLAEVNGRYYLIANVHKYSQISHYRLDRIMDIKLKRRKAKPLARVDGYSEGVSLKEYITQHPYMYSGPVYEYRIRVKRSGINDVLDWFGTETSFDDISEKYVEAIVKSDESSMDLWLHRYYYESEMINKEGDKENGTV